MYTQRNQNATGPGRPLGRDDQDSLSLMSARQVKWDYPKLLMDLLKSSRRIEAMDKVRVWEDGVRQIDATRALRVAR